MAVEAEMVELMKANTALQRERGRLQLQRMLQGKSSLCCYKFADI